MLGCESSSSSEEDDTARDAEKDFVLFVRLFFSGTASHTIDMDPTALTAVAAGAPSFVIRVAAGVELGPGTFPLDFVFAHVLATAVATIVAMGG